MDMIAEMKPPAGKNVLNILAVTHSAYIAQLIGYLYEDIDCGGIPVDTIKITNGIMDLLTTPIPNTSITTFYMEFDNFNNCLIYTSDAADE